MTRATNYYCRMPLRIMRKPYKTPEYRKEDPNQWLVKGLRWSQLHRVIWKPDKQKLAGRVMSQSQLVRYT